MRTSLVGGKEAHSPVAYFVVPAYNEAANIDFLLKNIRRFLRFFEQPFHVILVDDGSTDATVSEALKHGEKMPLEVISHDRNHGPGAAFSTGFRRVLELARDYDMMVTIEADNTSDLCPLYKMLEHCWRGSDLVLASVYGDGRVVGAPLFRRILSRGANVLMQIVFRIPGVNTFTSFFRVYKVSMLRKAYKRYGEHLIEEWGFICMLELLVSEVERHGLPNNAGADTARQQDSDRGQQDESL
jgi:dolichol-phosphate mannosyltransferase